MAVYVKGRNVHKEHKVRRRCPQENTKFDMSFEMNLKMNDSIMDTWTLASLLHFLIQHLISSPNDILYE